MTKDVAEQNVNEEQLGPLLADPTPAPWPSKVVLKGRYVTLEPLTASKHANGLYELVGGESRARLWDFMLDGPFCDKQKYYEFIESKEASRDPFWAIIENKNKDGSDCGDVIGSISYLRITPKDRVLEVGSLMYSSRLQKTPGATEAMYLLAKYAFEDLGYRRYEWKCNNLNVPSKNAALRYGFVFEGIFRKHFILKGRNRDTAWYSIVDDEWPIIRKSMELWLDPANFERNTGNQLQRLSDIRASLLNE